MIKRIPRKIKKAFKYLALLSVVGPMKVGDFWAIGFGASVLKYRTKWVRKAKKLATAQELAKCANMLTDTLSKCVRNDLKLFEPIEFEYYTWDVEK